VFINVFLYTMNTTGLQDYSTTYGSKRRVCRSEWLSLYTR